MAKFTVDDFTRILRTGAGVDQQTNLDDERAADTSLVDLGYDSLAVLELTSRIEREYDIAIPDGDLAHTLTPREAATYVASRIAEVQV
ncbi:acyl carrier protein [Streptomyces hyaluromycini]|uniref:acyl carrier protein n=1 Tax=Streptomyces hyaluromycini TaxID=1377993 RepID=UPI000B5CDB31|nr:acyl carrier protein [Streptomyces hyaluromycini]